MKRLIAFASIFSLGHHIDHILQGNHVGLPLISEFTAFTLSSGSYPVIALGHCLNSRRRLGLASWSILASVSLSFVGLTHLGPFALAPPADIHHAHSSPVAGTLAFIWLLGFLLVLLFTGFSNAEDNGGVVGSSKLMRNVPHQSS